MISTLSQEIEKMQKLHLLLWGMVLSCLLLLIFTLDANAITEIDDAIKPTSRIEIVSANGLHSADITSTYTTILASTCPAEYSQFMAALSNEESRIAIAQNSSGSTKQIVEIGYATNPLYGTFFWTDQVAVVVDRTVLITIKDNGEITCDPGLAQGGDMIIGQTNWSLIKLLLSTFPATYPPGYEGEDIPGIDNADSDGDGLSNYVESPYYPLKRELFCNTDTNICAHPNLNEKDLYVEIDWMSNLLNTYKPTATQIGLVENRFATLGINFHADTGQYGGGNSIPHQAPLNVIDDFYPYKYGSASQEANFDTKRYKIWRYMISGYNFTDTTDGSTGLSGKAEGGGDDLFLSFGLLQDSPHLPSSFDNAIAGTIMHELGHSLCLSNMIASYVGQDQRCISAEIDNKLASLSYRSVMNHNYQFLNSYSFSNGTNGLLDHDDITAINIGMNDFINDTDDYTP